MQRSARTMPPRPQPRRILRHRQSATRRRTLLGGPEALERRLMLAGGSDAARAFTSGPNAPAIHVEPAPGGVSYRHSAAAAAPLRLARATAKSAASLAAVAPGAAASQVPGLPGQVVDVSFRLD